MVAAGVAAAAFTCRPAAGLGPVAYTRAAKRHVVDPATCRDRVVGSWRFLRTAPPGVVVRSTGYGKTAKQTIWANGRPIFTEREYDPASKGMAAPGPIWLFSLTPDRRWLLFTIDPYSSASIAADGLVLRVISTAGGPVRTLGTMLTYSDYRTWCGGRLVFTGGEDRIAWHDKRLLTASPPDWRARPLVPNAGRAWGSLACAPDGRGVVVQTQPASDETRFGHAHWALVRVGFDGSVRALTSPPPGSSDETPRFAGSTLFFVRSTNLHGALYALRSGRVAGPFARLGFSFGYYGHHDWPYTPR